MTKAPPRPSISKARRARIFAQHGGICGISGRKIGSDDEWQVEHRIPWAISFDDSDENLYPALTEPHKEKTRKDVKDAAKCKRMGCETGQAARRAKRGHSLIKSNPNWPKGRKIPSRPFEKREK